MALAAGLLKGFKYTILSGRYAGEEVTILDNTPFPDGDPEGRQRKVTVLDPEGNETYILPRMLSDQPTGRADGAEEPQAPVFAPAPAAPQYTEQVYIQPQDEQGVPTGQPIIAYTAAPITDPMDPRLDHLRPSRRKLDNYIRRDMGNGMDDIEFFLQFTSQAKRTDPSNAGRPGSVALKGDTQSGKTLLVECLAIAWADKLGYDKPMPIFTISGSAGVTDFDLFGQTTSYTDPTTGQSMLVWLPGMAELAAQCGGIFYMDEINAVDPRFTSSLHPMIDHRHMFVNRNKAVWRKGQFMAEVVSVHMDMWAIATFNESYQGMGKMNEAFLNRFEHLTWGYDKDVESKLIKSPAILLLGERLRMAREKNSIRTPVGTSALQRAEANVHLFGPVVGLGLLTSMFGPPERPIVESIIQDSSIIIQLNEELKQADSQGGVR